MWDKKTFWNSLLAYIHMDYFLIFSYEILTSQKFFKNFSWVDPC